MKNFYTVLILLVLVPIAGLVALKVLDTGTEVVPQVQAKKVTVYKSSTCGCCRLYVGYLEQMGYEVNVEDTENMDEVKARYDIPEDKRSCHTTVIDDYFVEGHIPIEAVKKMMTDKPAIKGIAMPGMPSGSPGMPGAKYGPFEISQLGNEGNWSNYMSL